MQWLFFAISNGHCKTFNPTYSRPYMAAKTKKKLLKFIEQSIKIQIFK